MRKLLDISLIFILVCVIWACVPKEDEVNKPNVLFILADDLGYGDLQVYNSKSKIPTPNLDQLAKDGIQFTNAHSPSAVCTPTRYGLLTGRYAWRTRLKQKVLWPYAQPLIDDDRKTLADLFKEQGYYTAMFGKWHLGWQWAVEDSLTYPWVRKIDGNWGGKGIDLSKQIKSGPNGAGFDYAFGVDYPNSPPYAYIENGWIVGGQPQGKKTKDMFGSGGLANVGWKQEDVLPTIIDKTKHYLDTISQPFFTYLSLTSPHTPIRPSQKFEGKAKAGDYGDFVYETDIYVGEIIELLDKRGLLENTLIIFTSDNGSPAKAGDEAKRPKEWSQFGAAERMFGHYSNAPQKGYKAGLYEGGHRVPFIAYWKGKIKAGQTSNQLFGLQDMMATFHSYFNEEMTENVGVDSYDISNYLFKNNFNQPARDHIISHGGLGTFAITKDNWKFIADSSSGGTSYKYREMLGTYVSKYPGQLYDLSNDPQENNDLFATHPEKVKELRSLLINYIEKGKSTPGENQDNDAYPKEWKQYNYLKEGFDEK